MQSAHAESRSLVPVVSTSEADQNARAFDANAEPSAAGQRAVKTKAANGSKPGKPSHAAPIGKAAASGDKASASAAGKVSSKTNASVSDSAHTSAANKPASTGVLGKSATTGKSGAVAKAPRRSGRQPSSEYVRMRDSWHAAIQPVPELPTPPQPDVFPPLVLAPVNGGERVSVMPETADGSFSPKALREAARALSPGRRVPHPIAPHLLELVYRAMRHFQAPLVHVISGFRADRAGSRHTQGRAMDFVLPGVSNEQLASYVQQFGFVGVGIYPNSGFVHLDVRPVSFFWIDESLPDEKCKTQQILAEHSKRADVEARDRGEEPDFFVPNNDREDRAAARAYKLRAQRKAAAAAAQASRSL